MKYIKASLMMVVLLVLVAGEGARGMFVGETSCHERYMAMKDSRPTWRSLSIVVEIYPSDEFGEPQRDLIHIKIKYPSGEFTSTWLNSSERLKLINLLKEGLECCRTAKESKMKIEKTLGSVVDTDNNSLAVVFKSEKKADKINVIIKVKDSDYYLYESEVSYLAELLEKAPEMYLAEKKRLEEEKKKAEEEKKKAEEEKKKAEEEKKKAEEEKKKAAEEGAIEGIVTMIPAVTGGVYDSPAMKVILVEAFPADYNGGAYINSYEFKVNILSMLEPSLASAQFDEVGKKVQTLLDKYRKNAKPITNSQRLEFIQLLKKGLKWTETAKSNKVDIKKPLGNLTGPAEIRNIMFHSENKAEKVYVSMQLRDIETGEFRTVKFTTFTLTDKEAQRQKIEDQLVVAADQSISRGLFEDVKVEIELEGAPGQESELRDFILVLEKVPEHAKLLKEEEAKKKKAEELFK